ncbi:TPA: hypothetical protein ACPWS4_004838 [Pseudomonas aeruginosa]|uniref:hypothetical protein n=1 Tax=Pseudomonas aeruginosa TaxID=287 RepID=UPI00201376BE|nr:MULTISPECIES: hypothetical protein [Pseudomonadaceae]
MSTITALLSSRPPLKLALPMAALAAGCAALAFAYCQDSSPPLQPNEVQVVRGFITRTGDPVLIAAYNATVSDGALSRAEAEGLIERAKAAPPVFLLTIPPKK